ncbi:MAG: hypothetical protein NTZ43_07885 [Gemmatimonadetes bacterium]|nr:hypothetical protein [Gemmatimonadota bacterium]
MAEPNSRGSSVRGLALWVAFSLVLAFGVVLYFRFADHITPLLDVVTDR